MVDGHRHNCRFRLAFLTCCHGRRVSIGVFESRCGSIAEMNVEVEVHDTRFAC